MTLDRATKQELIEARERIKAQLVDDWRATTDQSSKSGPPDFRDVYAELKDELRQIDEMLGIDPDNDDQEPGDEDEDAVAAAEAVEPNCDAGANFDENVNALASRVVVDDATTFGLSRVVMALAIVGIVIAIAVALWR